MSVCFSQQNTTRLGHQGEGRLAMLTFRQLRYAFKCNFENIWIRKLGWIAQDLYVGQIDERHDCRSSSGLHRVERHAEVRFANRNLSRELSKIGSRLFSYGYSGTSSIEDKEKRDERHRREVDRV